MLAAAAPIPLPQTPVGGSIFKATHPYWCPRGWLPCDGRELAIAAFQELFDVIGGTCGQRSPATFSLPDLRGYAPCPDGSFELATVIATHRNASGYLPAGCVAQVAKKSPALEPGQGYSQASRG